MTIIATVFKTGGRYTSEHVTLLEQQLGHLLPLTVFTDDEGMIEERGVFARRLTDNLPGWWSKMELFNPVHQDDIIYLDLDTAIRRAPTLMWRRPDKPSILRDFYRPMGLQSSVMIIPHWFKPTIWDIWSMDPQTWMEENKIGGDQTFLETCGLNHWERIQDRYPGEFVSWKVDNLAENPLSPHVRAIVFHGDPKPWDIPNALQSWRHP